MSSQLQGWVGSEVKKPCLEAKYLHVHGEGVWGH